MNVARIFKFSIVGVINTSIDLSIFTFLVHIIMWEVLPANIVSYSIGVFNSFIMNKHWTFQDRTHLSSSLGSFVRFALINVSSLIISSGVVYLLALYFSAILAKVSSICVVFIWNYSLTRLFVFKTSN